MDLHVFFFFFFFFRVHLCIWLRWHLVVPLVPTSFTSPFTSSSGFFLAQPSQSRSPPPSCLGKTSGSLGVKRQIFVCHMCYPKHLPEGFEEREPNVCVTSSKNKKASPKYEWNPSSWPYCWTEEWLHTFGLLLSLVIFFLFDCFNLLRRNNSSKVVRRKCSCFSAHLISQPRIQQMKCFIMCFCPSFDQRAL